VWKSSSVLIGKFLMNVVKSIWLWLAPIHWLAAAHCRVVSGEFGEEFFVASQVASTSYLGHMSLV